MCSQYAKYGLGIILLALVGLFVGAVLAVFGFVSLWWMYPDGWEVQKGLQGQPQELLALRVPDYAYLLRTADGSLFECRQGGPCALAGVDWSAEQDARLCTSANRPWVTALLPVALNWNASVVLGCEVDYMSTGRNVFVMQDRAGNVAATYGAVFIPTDAGVIIVGLLGGLFGMLAGGAAGVLVALVRMARKRKQAEA